MKMHPRRARHLLAGLGLALGAGMVTPVMAMPGGPDAMWAQGPGGGGPRHGGPEGRMFGGGLMRMLDRVNATPQQRAQIEQILKAGAADRRAQFEAHRALREQGMALFAQPTVDAAAVEALRQKQLAMHDAATKRMMDTMIEISRVLTPEQRKQLADFMAQRREMMQRHQRERQNLDTPKG